MNDDEKLSRLLDGDLPPAEAEALRGRLAAEPALTLRFAALQAALRTLGSLDADLPAPARPRALGARAPTAAAAFPPAQRRPPPSSARWLLPLAAAAIAAGLTFTLRPAPPALSVITGTSVVTGRGEVLVAGLPLTIDGKVRIAVEPPGGAARATGAEISTMDRSHLLTALAGSLVTVTVLEGQARLAGAAETEPAVLAAGQSAAVTVGGTGRDRSEPAVPRDLAAAQARIRDLEKQLAVARLDAGLSHGAVAAHEGKPIPWPDDIAPAYQADGFRSRLEAAARGVPGAAVAAVDCDEFPCIVVLATTSDADDWSDQLRVVHDRMSRDPGFGDVAVTAMAQATDDGVAAHRLYAFALTPAPEAEAAQTRTQFRAKAMMDELASAGSDADMEPADVERLRTLGYIGD